MKETIAKRIFADTFCERFTDADTFADFVNEVDANRKFVGVSLSHESVVDREGKWAEKNYPLCSTAWTEQGWADTTRMSGFLPDDEVTQMGLTVNGGQCFIPLSQQGLTSLFTFMGGRCAALSYLPREKVQEWGNLLLAQQASNTHKGVGLLNVSFGKIRSINSKGYLYLPIGTLKNKFEDVAWGIIPLNFEEAVYSHEKCCIQYRIAKDAEIEASYKSAPVTASLMKRLGDWHLAVKIATSDVGDSAVRISLALVGEKGQTYPMGTGFRLVHKGAEDTAWEKLNAFVESEMLPWLEKTENAFNSAADVKILHATNCIVNVATMLGCNADAVNEGASDYVIMGGLQKTSALEVWFAVSDICSKTQMSDEQKLVQENKLGRLLMQPEKLKKYDIVHIMDKSVL